ncbi:hypothetical protein [Sphingobacterium sp. DR205]|uniref:VOC family protein n=1 Tax=Sphingobacterium sp. DR205 TaxID=2713573 RepID=UPI0013E43524|nr:hypothetical protein [Sphingobacterium sp. DR205]QIH33420.1 hypothetical protein G6053_11230 [Sphingobacterium sp. DR205]
MHLKEVSLLATEIELLYEFYIKLLGFPSLYKSSEFISLKIGSSILNFSLNNNEKHLYHFAIEIPINLLEKSALWLQKKGLNLVKPSGKSTIIVHHEVWNAYSIYFYDVLGNLIEFIVRVDNNIFSDADHFGPDEIVRLSEVGTGVQDPVSSAEFLTKHFDVKIYDNGPQNKAFVCIGDSNGLLILSKTDRLWFPSSNLRAVKSKIIIDTEIGTLTLN